ncbi:MAG: HAMP domain-containing sensor histidine kinase [Pseudomonadota bacterium]
MTALRPLTAPFAALAKNVRDLGLRALVLAIGALALLNVAFVAVATLMGEKQSQTLLAPPIMSQAAAAANLMDALEAEKRVMALDALSSPMLRMEIAPDFSQTPAVENPAPVFVPIISAYAAVLGERAFSIYARDEPRWGLLRRAHLTDDLIIVMRLADGSGLVVEAGASFRRAVGVYGLAIAFSVASMVLIGLMAWASLSYARPLARLAAASETFAERIDAGDDVDALPETGPKPVRDLAIALNLMRARLRRLMAERTTTLAAIAHDMRTYLTRLRMRSEFIGDARQREKAVRDLEDMTQLLEDALWLGESAAAPPPRERIALGEWLAAYVAQRAELGEPVVLRRAARDADPAAGAAPAAIVDAAAPELARALNNLVDNALRYAGEATLRLDAAAPESIAIEVLDRGPGVPEAFLERMTDPFARLEASRSRDTGGAGLGLAIAKALVERVGGTVSLANRDGGGFRARMILPRAAPPET